MKKEVYKKEKEVRDKRIKIEITIRAVQGIKKVVKIRIFLLL
jgi:hypothetical protein